MNFYDNLNEMILYIEDNLDKEVDYNKLSLIVGVNTQTLQKIFSLLSGLSLGEYIRKRRLTQAGQELAQSNIKVIDVAIKYGWSSPTAFSRSFLTFHGVKPSQIKKKKSMLKYYPKLEFEVPSIKEEMEYEIEEKQELVLYGLGVKSDYSNIKNDAPNLFVTVKKEFKDLPSPLYGMVKYQNRDNSDSLEYWVLWEDKYLDFEEVIIPKSKWLKFRINSAEAKDIQEMSQRFYLEFLPTGKYVVRDIPELEYYHDNVCDFLVPIN